MLLTTKRMALILGYSDSTCWLGPKWAGPDNYAPAMDMQFDLEYLISLTNLIRKLIEPKQLIFL